MIKTYLTIILVLTGFANSYSQKILDTDGLNNLNNVYLYSLKEYCQTLDSTKVNNVYVERSHFVGDSWPKKINGFTIYYLQNREYKRIIKENNGSITIVGIRNLEFRQGQFSISVIPFSTTYYKKIVHLINGGGMTVNFYYDPELKGLIFQNSSWNGI